MNPESLPAGGVAPDGIATSAKPSRRRVFTSVRVVVLSVLLAGSGLLFLAGGGRLIVDEETFQHADVALVLSGDPVRRTLAARDLIKAGKVDRIVIIPEPRDALDDELARLGLIDPSRPPVSQRILNASGVPPERVAFLRDAHDGTINEAKGVARHFAGRLPARLAIITSRSASRRACFVFRRVLRGTEIACAPTHYDTFEARYWWRNPRNALAVVTEYEKLIVNALSLAFGGAGT